MFDFHFLFLMLFSLFPGFSLYLDMPPSLIYVCGTQETHPSLKIPWLLIGPFVPRGTKYSILIGYGPFERL